MISYFKEADRWSAKLWRPHRDETMELNSDEEPAGEPDLEPVAPPPPLFLTSVRLDSFYVTRVRFSNGAEVWLPASEMHVGAELTDLMERNERIPLWQFASMVSSENRVVSVQQDGLKLMAPRLDHIKIPIEIVDGSL